MIVPVSVGPLMTHRSKQWRVVGDTSRTEGSIKGSIPTPRCGSCKWTRKKKLRFAGLLQSPLPDSNRRPPPYHAIQMAAGGNRAQRSRASSSRFRACGGRTFATDCAPSVPYLFHGNWPKPAVSSPVTPDCALGTSTLAQTRPTTLVESRSSSLRRRPLSRARGNRDKPHLCAGFTLK
jgi:hypothetical protein